MAGWRAGTVRGARLPRITTVVDWSVLCVEGFELRRAARRAREGLLLGKVLPYLDHRPGFEGSKGGKIDEEVG